MMDDSPGLGKCLAILGAGGLAREVFWYAREFGIRDICFVDDVSGVSELVLGGEAVQVVTDWGDFRGPLGQQYSQFITAVGDARVKALMVRRALEAGLQPSKPIVHPRAILSGRDCKVGAGSIICPGVAITTNVTVGSHVLVNLNVTIGHDTVIGDYSTLNPGANISGNVTIGHSVLIGTGSTIRDGITISHHSTIGAQAGIVKDVVEPASVVVGVPGKTIRTG